MASKSADVFTKFLLTHFPPAKEFREANHYLTTQELCEQLGEMGVLKGSDELYGVMKEMGYVMDVVEGKGLCWLVL